MCRRRSIRNARVALAAGLIAALFSLQVFADAGGDFDAGVGAYQSGNIALALVQFQRAEEAGLDIPALQFNLGLCHYRLNQDEAARARFVHLRAMPGYSALAEYHLALIAYRSGDTPGALQHLDAAVAADERLRERSALARARFTQTAAPARSAIYLYGAGGYDSNVALIADAEVLALEHQGDGFGEAQGAVEYRSATAQLNGALYLRHYARADDFNTQVANADAAWVFARDAWQLSAGPGGTLARLGGERMLEYIGPRLSLERGGAWQRRLRYQLDSIQAAPAFEHLSGWRHRLRLAAHDGRCALSYEFEYNERKDLRQGAEFFSHSPLRHRLRASVALRADAELLGELRYSRYRDPNRFREGGQLREERRVETLGMLGLRLRWPQTQRLRPLAELRGTWNEASLDALDYTRLELMLGAEWLN